MEGAEDRGQRITGTLPPQDICTRAKKAWLEDAGAVMSTKRADEWRS